MNCALPWCCAVAAIFLPIQAAHSQDGGGLHRANASAELPLRLVGFPTALIYEWEVGIPGGWVRDEAAKSQKRALTLLETARGLFKEGEAFDPSQLHGTLVVTIDAAPDSQGRYACRVGWVIYRRLSKEESRSGTFGFKTLVEECQSDTDDGRATPGLYTVTSNTKRLRLAELRMLDKNQLGENSKSKE